MPCHAKKREKEKKMKKSLIARIIKIIFFIVVIALFSFAIQAKFTYQNIFYDNFDNGNFISENWTQAFPTTTESGTTISGYGILDNSLSYNWNDNFFILDSSSRNTGHSFPSYTRIDIIDGGYGGSNGISMYNVEYSSLTRTNAIDFLCFGSCSCNMIAFNFTTDNNYHDLKVSFDKDTNSFSIYRDGLYKGISVISGCNFSNYELSVWTRQSYTYIDWINVTQLNYCYPDWSCNGYDSCIINDTQYCNSVIDLNSCDENYTGDYSEFIYQSCDYCTPSWNCSYYGNCTKQDILYCNDTIDYNSCYSLTGLETDSYTGNFIEFGNMTCDFCTPDWICSNFSICNYGEKNCVGYNDLNYCNEEFIENPEDYIKTCGIGLAENQKNSLIGLIILIIIWAFLIGFGFYARNVNFMFFGSIMGIFLSIPMFLNDNISNIGALVFLGINLIILFYKHN